MTNKEIYDILKEGDPIRIGTVLPRHYLAKGEKFVLPEGKTEYGALFDVVNNVAELDKWYLHNYNLSGKYSDNLTMVLLPEGPNVRIEIRDKQIYKALWAVKGIFIDITHNVNFLDGIPIGRMPSDTGYIHGTVISKLKEDKLYKLLVAPLADERILDCKFVVSYAYFFPIMFDTISDMFDTLTNLGFKTAAFIATTIPKWSRAIENAKIMAGTPNQGYRCTKVLTAYSDMRMIEMLSGNVSNWWGVTTDIPPTNLFEVIGLAWTTIVNNNKINVIPVISFTYGNYAIDGIKNSDIVVDKKYKIFYKMINEFEVADIGNYCIGDIFDGTIDDNILNLNRRFGSKNLSIVTPCCPKCGQGIDIINNKVFCVNIKCPAVILNNIRTWINKFCANINEYAMTDFLLKYEIANISDIYMVVDSGDVSITDYSQIFEGVENSRSSPAEFLNIIIPFLTIEECDEIMKSFWLSSNEVMDTTNHMFSTTTLDRMGFNSTTADKLVRYMENNKLSFVNTIRRYLKHKSYHKLYKRTFFIDGLLYDKDKIKYERFINSYCGRVVSQFAPHISGFIYGKYINNATFVAVKELSAHKDVAIYSEEEFNKLVEQADGGTM